jgi:hypothetical protein
MAARAPRLMPQSAEISDASDPKALTYYSPTGNGPDPNQMQ